MANKSATNFTIQLYPKQDDLIINWLRAMHESRPRFASVYAREALHYYIRTGKYLNLGSVAVQDNSSYKKVLSIAKDEILNEWLEELAKSKLSAAPFARSILNKCIQVSDDDKNHLPDFIDIMQPRINFSIDNPNMAEKQQDPPPAEAERPEVVPPATEKMTASTETDYKDDSIAKVPKKKRKSSIIDKLGSALE
ncbi:hypothetical protein QMP26_41045 (plasmid) [Enterocloster clostridioformis]